MVKSDYVVNVLIIQTWKEVEVEAEETTNYRNK